MAQYVTENIRTVALVGHGAAGKTTLAEALLAREPGDYREPAASSGARRSATSIRSKNPGSTRCALRCCTSTSTDTRIHLIDTPGFPDFIGQAIRRARRRGDRRRWS